MRQYSVSDAARELTKRMGQPVPPRLISDLFYQRRLSDERCPVVGRIRLVPEDYLPEIEEVIRGLEKPSSAPTEEELTISQ